MRILSALLKYRGKVNLSALSAPVMQVPLILGKILCTSSQQDESVGQYSQNLDALCRIIGS